MGLHSVASYNMQGDMEDLFFSESSQVKIYCKLLIRCNTSYQFQKIQIAILFSGHLAQQNIWDDEG
jgi:hypothetical protein